MSRSERANQDQPPWGEWTAFMAAELEQKLQARRRSRGAERSEPREPTTMQPWQWPAWADVAPEGLAAAEAARLVAQDDLLEDERWRVALARFRQQLEAAEQRTGEEQREGDRAPNQEPVAAPRHCAPIRGAATVCGAASGGATEHSVQHATEVTEHI